MSQNDHAPLAPSAAHEWVNCSLSAHLSAISQNLREGDEDQEGEAAHQHAAHLLAFGEITALGSVSKNGVVVTDEMIDGSILYSDHILRVLLDEGVALTSIQAHLFIEQHVRIPSVHEQCYGTPDAYALISNLLGEDGRYKLHLFDYKFGHRFVEVFENWQLLLYVIGVLDGSGLPSNQWDRVDITMHIIQPRSYTPEGQIRQWSINGGEVLRSYIAKLAGAATAAMSVATRFGRAGAHCRDCIGRYRCQALQQAAYAQADYAGRSLPVDLDDPNLSRELRWLHEAQRLLEARVTGLEQQALHRLQSGAHLQDYGIDFTKPHRRWRANAEDVITMGALMGKDLAKAGRECITPAQAKKLGIDESVIAEYAFYPSGTAKLVPVDTTKTRKLFG